MNLVLEHEDSTVTAVRGISAAVLEQRWASAVHLGLRGVRWAVIPSCSWGKAPSTDRAWKPLATVRRGERWFYPDKCYTEPLMVLQDSHLNSNMNFHCFQGLILGQTLDSSHRCQISLHSVWFLEGSCGYFICISTRDTLFSSVTCKWL